MRSALPAASVSVRHGGRVFVGIIGSMTSEQMAMSGGTVLDSADGLVRVLVSDLGSVHPEAGDEIEVHDTRTKQWLHRVIKQARYDQTGATILLLYGARYG